MRRSGTCHCGAVEFEVELDGGLGEMKRCNCSLCRRKGAIMAFVPVERLTVVKGVEMLTLYQWNTRIAKHYFCKICGIYTHHQRRMNQSQYGFNVACLDEVDTFSLADIGLVDGKSQSLAQAPS